MREALKYGFILAVVCLSASGLLAAVNQLTQPLIEQSRIKEQQSRLKEVLPQGENFEPVMKGGKILYYQAYDQQKGLIGVAFIASAKGYASTIDTMVGMLNDGTISAISVLSHNETPGLGSRIEEVKEGVAKPWFGQQFSRKKTSEFSQIQAISGATISSMAVINSVKVKAEEIKKIISLK